MKKNYFYSYLKEVPLALAIERTIECQILSNMEFRRPILDVGVGEGIFASQFFDSKVDLGIDPNPRELERAKYYGAYAEIIQCYGDRIPRADKSFQTVLSNSVLEHISEIRPTLREINRLLKDDGTVYLTLPTNLFDHYSCVYQVISSLGLKQLAERYRVGFNKFWQHYHYYDRHGWTQLFEEEGFRVENCIEYGSKPIALLNDFLAPFAIFSFLQKKFFNRWFMVPVLRKPFAKILSILFQPATRINVSDGVKDGGLIFFKLRKKEPLAY